MKEPRTTIEYKGVTYPFYVTNRGKFDFENAGFSTDDIAKGNFGSQLALVYFNLRDCAKRAGQTLSDSFEEFIDNSDSDIVNVFIRLKEERERLAGDESKNVNPEVK